MAISIQENRSILDDADDNTSWNQGAATTTDFAEGIASITAAISETTGQIFYDGATTNFSTAGNELIYIWSGVIALQNSWQDGIDSSHAIWLSDGTNELVLMNAGNDRITFQHSEGQVLFQCFLIDVDYIDTKDAAGEIYENAGTVASFNAASVTEVGAYFVNLTKALGGGTNSWVDIIRYGTEGISIYGGSSSDPGGFLELVIEDRSTADGRGLGLIREYTAGAYGCQGTLKFGTSGATGNAYFEDAGASVTYEDRDVGNDKFKFIIQGNSTDSNDFILTNSLITSARPGVTADMSSANIDTLELNAVTFSNLLNEVSFPTDSASFTHEVTNCVFQNCGQVDPGTATLTGCTFSDSNTPTTGAMLLDSDGTDNLSSLTFVTTVGAVYSGAAIYITSAGNYTLTNFTYSGYGTTDSGEAAIYNNSGGHVNLTISGGDSPTYDNGASATTSVISAKTINYHVENADGDDVENAQVYIQKATPTAQTSGAGNIAGDGDLVVTTAIDADIPSTGWVIVFDKSENATQPYRYVSWTGSTFTFATSATGAADDDGTSTQLLDTGAFTGTIVVVGDTIRNTTDNSWAVVDQVVSTDELLTSPLRGGSNNTWLNGNGWSVHDLATDLVSGVDTVDIPLVNKQTDSNGDIAVVNFNFQSTFNAVIRIRANEGTTKYVPFITAAQITGSYSGSAVIQEDAVAT